jgi:signal transduction histidine kinase
VARRIAHSILKPVTAVSEQLRLLAPTLADPAARADLENAAQLMGQVQRLVRDLLDLARAQGVPDRRRLDLRSLLEHAVLGFRSRFPEAHVELTADDGHLVADEVGMGCLLGNLLDNAAEADPPGWIRVVARHWAPSVEISIEDRSGGLAREVRERLFEPFVTTKPRGTGLGLAVAREVCRSHGGHLEALPTDRGTRFVVTLPLEGD